MSTLGMKTQSLNILRDLVCIQIPDELISTDKALFHGGKASVYNALGMYEEAVRAYLSASATIPSESRWLYLLSRVCRAHHADLQAASVESAIAALERYFSLLIAELENTSSVNSTTVESPFQLYYAIRTLFDWASNQLDGNLSQNFCCVMIPLIYHYKECMFKASEKTSKKTNSFNSFVCISHTLQTQRSKLAHEPKSWLNAEQNIRWRVCSALCLEADDALLSLYSTESIFHMAARVRMCLLNVIRDRDADLTERERKEIAADEDMVCVPYDGSWAPEVLNVENLRIPLKYNCPIDLEVPSKIDFDYSEKSDETEIKAAIGALNTASDDVRAINSLMRCVMQSRQHGDLGLESFNLKSSLIEFCQKNKRHVLSRLYCAMRGVSQRKFNDAFESYLDAFSCDRNQPVTSLSLAVLLMLFAGQKNVRERYLKFKHFRIYKRMK
jgi:tetratricopeptide (TPR) repeat protein